MTDAAEILRLIDAAKRIPYCPQIPEPKQRAFLASNARELLFGGAAGGGKSSTLLMGALQYVDVPGYSAILFRKTYADLSKPGALMARAAEWLRPTGAHWNEQKKQWRFPNVVGPGAVLSFGFLDGPLDRFNYAGAEYHFCGFDELTTMREVDYLFLHGSRMRRSSTIDVPLRTRATSNPGGTGHKWVQQRFGITAAGKQHAKWKDGKLPDGSPRTVTAAERPFIPSKLVDNPHVDATSYRGSMAELDTITRDQLEHGLWVLDDSQLIYKYDPARNGCDALPTTFETTDHAGNPATIPLNANLWRFIFVTDLGSSVSARTTGFAFLAWHPHIDPTYVVASWAEAGMIPSTLAEKNQEILANHPGCELIFDEGALGHGYGNEMRDRYHLPVIAAEKRDKAGARRLLNGALEQGLVRLIRSTCVDLSDELETLVWNKAGNDAAPGMADHCSDALLYGWRRSQAHRSEAPSKTPPHGSDEWFAAEERRLLDLEYERAERSGDETPWTNWRG